MPSKKSPANQALGKAIRAARRELGWGQEPFARREDVGLSRTYFGAVERGEFNVSLDMILKIAAGLNMTGAELMRRAKL
jgi:transcriptional regulator with XRE-family HTH domain